MNFKSRIYWFVIFSLICNLNFTLVEAQKHDNIWIFGYTNVNMPQAAGLDFYFGPPNAVGFNTPFSFFYRSDVCMSSPVGDLLFYSNGIEIANWNNQILANSVDFNFDPVGNNYTFHQGILSIPFPDHPNQFVLFHFNGNYILPSYYPIKLYYSVIDMNANNGLGEMVLKKQTVFADTLLSSTMQATRHANGRDWWIINHKAYSNMFYVSLLTPSGVIQNNTYAAGPYLTYFLTSRGQSEFSPDGSKYAMAFDTYNSIYLFDFDRCSGTISYKDSVQIIPNDINELPVRGCEFSPNSRYLYANTNNDLYQFDTWSTSLASGIKLIAQHNTPSHDFFRNKLGPDGKIYIASDNYQNTLSVINSPDEGDTLCDFVQDQLLLSAVGCHTLPEFPNYRLGPVVGSVCDSLTGLSTILNDADYAISVFPNPSSGDFEISYLLDSDKNGEVLITDVLGKIVYKGLLSPFTTKKSFHIPELKSGIYQISINSGNHNNATRITISK
ncbi:MAG TPA: T9SS type A sorting domain-containing protein [Bacteroidia bacterium]|nr:T9SS type A sorting domain-containing protein [Bacteroidia bacterium]